MKNTFGAQGLTFKKSSYSQTDWTQQCLGLALAAGRFHMGDSVTEKVLTGFPPKELAALLAGVK